MAEYKLSCTASEIDEKLKQKYPPLVEDSVILVPEAAVEFERVYDGIGVYSIETPLDIVAGDTLKVDWDGNQYDCTVHSGDEDVVWFGNRAIAGGEENTGEPFCYACRREHATFYELNAGTHTFSIIKYTETIDPKYLPNKVLDLDAMGLTPYVLELANQGGGRTYLHSYEVDIVETIYDKFPTSWDFVAKLTISEPESMYVKPVYTTFGEDGYHIGHFDSYLLTNQETLNKFFVRIFRYSYNDNIKGLVKVIDIHVGFYT